MFLSLLNGILTNAPIPYFVDFKVANENMNLIVLKINENC